MKRIFRILTMALFVGMLSSVGVEAQNQQHNGGRNGVTNTTENRRNHNARTPRSGGNDRGARPGVGQNGNHRRPDHGNHNGHGGNNVRPGNPPGRPDHGGNNVRPGHGGPGSGSHGYPGGGYDGRRPGGRHPSAGPMPRPHRPGHPGMMPPPHRPYRPHYHRPAYRPMPPRGWHPAFGLPVIGGVLGLNFGTGLSVSLNFLQNAGYMIDGYANDVVYLRNVNALDYMWTDGALYYGDGGFETSSFYYSTPTYNISRYNNVYAMLMSTYGAPVAIENTGVGMSATWFGGNRGYITLSYAPATINGYSRFLTTLSFGM